MQLLILNYHRVGKPTPQHRYRGMFVSPTHLRFHVRYLQQRGFRFVTLAEALHLASAPEAPRRLACITFDDGYVDNLERGFPVLKRLGVPATLYVVTGDVGKKNLVWSEAGEPCPANLLNWDQLRLLRDAGWEIGSHADRHVHLSRYPAEHQHECIEHSRLTMLRELGEQPVTFAYPYGDYNADLTPRLVKQAGFQAAVTTKPGINPWPPSDSLQLKRIPGKGFRLYHYLTWVCSLRRFLR